MEPRRILVFQVAFSLLGAISIVLWGRWEYLLPFVLGALLALVNLAGTAYAWPRILDKKSVALPVGIIVSKFAITIGVLYRLMKPSAFDQLNDWFFKTHLVPYQVVPQEPVVGGFMALVAFIAGIALVLPAVAAAHLVPAQSAGERVVGSAGEKPELT